MGRHLFLLLLALLLASTVAAAAVHGKAAAAFTEERSIAAAGISGVLGSTPPNCEGRCRTNCGHCVAVQVPISPQQQQRKKQQHGHGTAGGGSRATVMPVASYDDHSNYKPLSWRCKCRRRIPGP